jgi:hypothetical protein
MRSFVSVFVLLALWSADQAAAAAPHETRTKSKRSEKVDSKLSTHEVVSTKIAAARNARGLYVRGDTASRTDFDAFLARAVEHGLDTIVLDAKDYDGLLTYPSKVPLAVESGATAGAPIEDFGAAIKMAQKRGLRVAVRVSCFEDEHLAKARPNLSVQSKAGRAYPIGWLDPSNAGAQGYVLDLVKEALSFGPDEIQLDYVRYPVLGIKNADFKLEARGLTKPRVIDDFVKRVHAVTQAHGVPLSLDVFGVIAFGKREDIDGLGQDPVLLSQDCEVLSPMVYPSHYRQGFYGFDEPGDHPELVGMAIKALRAQIEASIEASGTRKIAVLRPWLQAMAWKSPAFSAGYINREIKSSGDAGGSGYLLWNPGQSYGTSWTALRANR